MRVATIIHVLSLAALPGCGRDSDRIGPASRSAESNPAAEALNPVWTLDAPAGVEWVLPLDRPPNRIVVCGRDGVLSIVQAKTGRSARIEAFVRPPRPAATGMSDAAASSQPAASSRPADGIIYCYDSFTVAAIDVEQASLRWHVGVWPDSQRQANQDPESMTKLLAAHAAHGGVLVAGDDGSIGMLDRESGIPRWQMNWTSMAECRIHVRGATAAVVFKTGNQARVAFLDLSDEPPVVCCVAIGDVMPFFSAFTSAGLVLAWSERLALLTTDGEIESIVKGTSARISNAALQVFTGPDGEAALLLADTRGNLSVFDLSTRKRRWAARWRELAASDSGGGDSRPADTVWAALSANADHVVAVGRNLYVTLDTATGKLRQRVELADYDPLSNAMRTGVDRTNVVARFTQPDAAIATLTLWRGSFTGEDPVRIGRLDHAEPDVRSVLFSGDLLLVVEQNRLSAYTLD